MQKYKTMAEFGGVGIVQLLSAVVTAIPGFFAITLFVLWIFLTAASYFVMLKTTGKKRFWNALTATSFSIFLASILLASMNSTEIIFLSGYWVGFYIVMTVISWVLLDRHK